jgi:hypothetical protein
MTAIRSRVARLEADLGAEDEIGLAEVLEHFYGGKQNPELLAAFDRTVLGQLLIEAARQPRQHDGAPSEGFR